MGNLGKLNIVISAVNKTKTVFKQVTQSLNKVKSVVGSALKAFGMLTAGVGALGGALGILFKKSFDFLDVIGKIASRTGATTDVIQAFQLSAIQSGASIETANKAIQKFAKMVGEARKGLKTYTDIFDRYGVSLLDAAGNEKTFNDVLFQTMEGMKESGDIFLRNADLALLFGRAGQELTNTILMGGKAFEIYVQKQKELGLILDGQVISATEAFNDRLSRIGFTFRVIRDAITTSFLPVLDDLAEQFETSLSKINAKKLGQDISIGIIDGLINALKGLDTFRMEFQRTFDTLLLPIDAVRLAVNGLGISFNLISFIFGRSATEIVENIQKINESTGQILQKFSQPIVPSETIANTVTGLESIRNSMLNAFGEEEGQAGSAVTKTKEKLSEFQARLQEFAQNAQAPLQQFADGFKTTGAMIGDTIVSSMKKFEDTLVDGLMSGKFAFKDFANFVIKELLRIAIKKLIIDKITGGFTSFLGGLGGKERGGTVTANKPYIVGEAGAELFVPNKTGTIVSNKNLGGGMASGGMPVNITYNIQAFDSKDTLTAITENAPTISAIIETEFNKRGRRGFVT